MSQKNPKGGGATTAGHIDNNDMFLKRALEKLLSEKDIKKSQHQQLKRACEAALGLFKLITYIKNVYFLFF
jgi:brefeldin A-inhibited guanine nucleotide-exchange protein